MRRNWRSRSPRRSVSHEVSFFEVCDQRLGSFASCTGLSVILRSLP